MSLWLCLLLGVAAAVSLAVVASVPQEQRGRRRRVRPQAVRDLVDR